MQEELDRLWERIEYLMEINGVTQTFLCKEIGHSSFFARRGANISMTTLIKISKALGYPLDEFFSSEDAELSMAPTGYHEGWVVHKATFNGASEIFGVYLTEADAYAKIKKLGAEVSSNKYPNKFVNIEKGIIYTVSRTRVHYT